MVERDIPKLELPCLASEAANEETNKKTEKMDQLILKYHRRCAPNATIQMLPKVIVDHLFTHLTAEELCQASRTTRDWVGYVENQTLWKNLCRTKWQVDFNELHMPKHYYKKPKLMYKFMTTVWSRVRRRCQEQQRVAALATVLRIPRESAQEVFLLCNWFCRYSVDIYGTEQFR